MTVWFLKEVKFNFILLDNGNFIPFSARDRALI